MVKKSEKFEPKRTINISLQSKKYYQTINEILQEWDDKNLKASTEVCESIILGNKINKSITLVGILNAYSTAERMIELYSAGREIDNLDEKLEAILSSAINIDMNKLIEAVKEQCSNINYSDNQKKTEKKTISAPVLDEEPINVENNEEITETTKEYNPIPSSVNKEENSQHEISIAQDEGINEDIEEGDKYADIPVDLLFNS